jgi:hypothetical protein
MNRVLILLCLAFLSTACSGRPELSTKELDYYKTFIETARLRGKGASVRSQAKELLREMGQPVEPELYGQAEAEKHIKCLEENREKRVPIVEANEVCNKIAPMPAPKG